MGSRSFPLGVEPNPLVYSIYENGGGNISPPENMEILTETGVPIDAETGFPLLIE